MTKLSEAKRHFVETRLLGQTFDYLKVQAFSHIGTGNRAHWVCECKCGAIVVRSKHTIDKNRARGRLNGCEACVPSRRITEQGPKLTPEQRDVNRKDSLKRHREKKARESRGRAQRKNRFGEPAIEREVSRDKAFVWHGKTVGEASNEAERAWLRRTFGD